jgi:SMODS and SLOG-associating 2TM effector domain 1/SMODS and SLOG-associating 2TM effector domain 3
MNGEPLTLERKDLPPLLTAAGKASARGQSIFIRGTALALTSGIAAAALSTPHFSGRWAPSLAGALFVVAAGTGVYLWAMKPERAWYDGRAAAESIKTLSWQYAVGGAQFPMSLAPNEADQLFLRRLREVLTSLSHLPIDPPGEPQITPGLRAPRSTSELAGRRDLYLRYRVTEQRVWYSQKARFNRRWSHTWFFAMICIQIIGAVVSLLHALDLLGTDLIALSAALAASVAAWLQAKDHSTLAEAYTVTAHELAAIESRINEPATETDWSAFVDDAEAAISREHVLWRARRGRIAPTQLKQMT